MKIKFTYVFFILLILGGCAFTAWKIFNRPQPAKSVSVAAIRAANGIPVTIYKIVPEAWEFWLPLYGTLRAPRQSQVSAAQQEYMIDIKADIGDTVKQGQLLAVLDDKNSLEKVDAARAKTKELEARYNRLNTIKLAGGSSTQDIEAAFTQLRASQATLRELTTELSRMKVISPIGGVVVKRNAETGQLNSPSKPLFEIADMSLIEVTLDVAPNVSPLIKPGMPAEVKADNGWISAVVKRINPLADESTGLYNCVLAINNPEQKLFRLGSTVECRVLIEKEETAIAVPYEVVREVNGKSVVFIASGDTSIEHPVKRGRIFSMKARILEGLSSGDGIVQKGVDRVYDGAKIWIQAGNQ